MHFLEGMPISKQHMAVFPTALETWKSSVKVQVRECGENALSCYGTTLFPSPPKKNIVSWHEGTEGDKSGYSTKLLLKKKF